MLEKAPRGFRWLITVAAVFGAIYVVFLGADRLLGLVHGLRNILTPLFFAFFIAYMLDPVADWFEDRGLHRGVGIAILLVATLGLLTLALVWVIPGVVEDITEFARGFPEKAQRMIARLEPLLREHDITLPRNFDQLLEQFHVSAQDAGRAVSPVSTVLSSIVGGTASVFGAIAGGLMIPVFAFYLLYDFDRIVAAVGELVPYRHRAGVFGAARDVDEVLGSWARGQFMVMLTLGGLYAIGYSIAGVPLAVPIGIVAGLLSFIPYVGPAVGLLLAIITCAVEGAFWPQMGLTVAAFGVVQGLDGLLVTPKIVGDKVGLSAIWVLIALMVGSELFGFLGVLMAVPAAAVVKVFVKRAVAAYRESEVFGDPSEDSRDLDRAGGGENEREAGAAESEQDEAPASDGAEVVTADTTPAADDVDAEASGPETDTTEGAPADEEGTGGAGEPGEGDDEAAPGDTDEDDA